MSVHIGKIIKAEVKAQRYTQKEFGALINKHEKTVPGIYKRAIVSIDLLITISAALKKDLFKYYYEEEPMKSLRDSEVEKLQNEIRSLRENIEQLQRELKDKQIMAQALQMFTEQLHDFKTENKKKQ